MVQINLLIEDRIRNLNEDSFIDSVMIPLLQSMDYHSVTRVADHGQNEYGQDIRLFYKIDEFGRRVYYGAQVKSVDISSNSTDTKGNVASISLINSI